MNSLLQLAKELALSTGVQDIVGQTFSRKEVSLPDQQAKLLRDARHRQLETDKKMKEAAEERGRATRRRAELEAGIGKRPDKDLIYDAAAADARAEAADEIAAGLRKQASADLVCFDALFQSGADAQNPGYRER